MVGAYFSRSGATTERGASRCQATRPRFLDGGGGGGRWRRRVLLLGVPLAALAASAVTASIALCLMNARTSAAVPALLNATPRNAKLFSIGGDRSSPRRRKRRGGVRGSSTGEDTGDDASFSACLLTMDDKHRLVEWIAYHYHALPLRYLVVAVDPRSATSPAALFERWRGRGGLEIVEWSDGDFMGDDAEARRHQDELRHFDELPEVERRDHHRRRQTRFIARCLRHVKEHNGTWTMIIDSDEFLHFNGPEGDRRVTDVPYRSVREPGALMRFLQEQRERKETEPCISLPRLWFGTKKSEGSSDHHTKKFLAGFDASVLNTMRYRHHGKRDYHKHQGFGKSIVDVSRIAYEDIPLQSKSVHKPLPLCAENWVDDKDAFFRINHYLGPWDAYSYRRDARWGTEMKGRENYDEKARIDEGTDDNIRPWLDGFVEDQGEDNALELLEGAGRLEPRITSANLIRLISSIFRARRARLRGLIAPPEYVSIPSRSR